MLQLLGYIFLIAIAIVLIKFGYALIMRCCALGIVAFICVGMVTGALAILRKISSDTAWTISEWAFYIGVVINVLEVLSHPMEALMDAWDFTTDTDYSGGTYTQNDDSSDSSGSSSSLSNERTDIYANLRCCGNCKYNKSAYNNAVMCTQNPAGQTNGVYDVCSDYQAY